VIIKGVGIDIVSLKRIEKLISVYGRKFEERVLNEEELVELEKKENKTEFVGGRFAIKEAITKVLGNSVPFKDLCILQDEEGKVFVKNHSDIFISILS